VLHESCRNSVRTRRSKIAQLLVLKGMKDFSRAGRFTLWIVAGIWPLFAALFSRLCGLSRDRPRACPEYTKGTDPIDTAIRYLDLFLASIRQLTAISQNLAKKANGETYAFLAYRRDLRDYRRKEESRVAMGDALNTAFSRPW
jgi:hypothetical protein